MQRKKLSSNKLHTANNSYIGRKIGRLKLSIARSAHVRCADIYISDSYISHISNKHIQEINKLGFKVNEYVNHIIRNYNQIRKGSEDSILLVVYHKPLHHVAAIRLSYVTKKGIWLVRSCQPRRTSTIEKQKLLWKNEV